VTTADAPTPDPKTEQAKAADLDRLREVVAERERLDAERLDLFRRLRSYDPPVHFDVIGAAAGISGIAVSKAIKTAARD
jgi:hypothetical protein